VVWDLRIKSGNPGFFTIVFFASFGVSWEGKGETGL
jgi:hypothetical protein